jgi:hypothetical protein
MQLILPQNRSRAAPGANQLLALPLPRLVEPASSSRSSIRR